jgi:hypothetical protein
MVSGASLLVSIIACQVYKSIWRKFSTIQETPVRRIVAFKENHKRKYFTKGCINIDETRKSRFPQFLYPYFKGSGTGLPPQSGSFDPESPA